LTPGVVTEDVPFGRDALVTVLLANGIATDTVTTFVVTTGDGVWLSVGLAVVLVGGVLVAVARVFCLGASAWGFFEVWAVSFPVIGEALAASAPGVDCGDGAWGAAPANAEQTMIASAAPTPNPAAERFRGRRSHVERRKISPYAAVSMTSSATANSIAQIPADSAVMPPAKAVIPTPIHVEAGSARRRPALRRLFDVGGMDMRDP